MVDSLGRQMVEFSILKGRGGGTQEYYNPEHQEAGLLACSGTHLERSHTICLLLSSGEKTGPRIFSEPKKSPSPCIGSLRW